jgi:TM2 domain-containing membrane protein YozV
MAPLRCCTCNCRGWNNGLLSLQGLIDSFDLCFIQEHWLHRDHLHKINNLSSEFLSVSVSGMDSGVLLQGRPFGGCSLIYRKSLAYIHISPCVLFESFVDSCGLSCLLICVYMPARSSSTASSEYLNTLGELQGFVTSQHFDVLLIAGDFNADFDPSGPFRSDFISKSVCL